MRGDCRDLLPRLPPACVDLVFADPPYFLQLEQTLYRPDQSRVDAVTDAWDAFDSLDAYDRFTEEWLAACRRLMADTATLWVIGSYHNIHRVGRILQDLGFWILNEVVWIKTNPMPNFRGVRFANAHETLLWAKKSKAQKRYVFNHHAMKALNGGKQMRSDWRLPICSGAERLRVHGDKVHSTQKPEALLERVILSSSRPGDLALDPFFGTGTTGAVAKRWGRRFLGIEREEGYLQAARARIAAVTRHSDVEALAQLDQRPARVPFADLVKAGHIPPGTTLLFHGDPDRAAITLPDGRVRFGAAEGSIHQMGAKASNLPACNGWEAWFARDAATGSLTRLEEYRRRWRESRAGE